MKANAVPLLQLFEKKMRLEVPLFQRQYVWSEDLQWRPLWEDIVRKFSEFLEGRMDAPVHFLGAIVLDQKQVPITHVERRMVIDGQQRLTTLQVFIAAFRDFCRSVGAEALASECENFTLNKGMMPDPNVDKFKVWPTKLDRDPFRAAVTAGGVEQLKKIYPLTWKKWARKPDPRPRIVDAYLFFYAELHDFFVGSESEPPLASDFAIEERLETCLQALRNALLVVSIDLEPGDDAQVIFETLNARGEPLLPADLLRNYIFLRAARQEESQDELYNKYWEPFDDEFWRTTVSQGRINRPRSDLFMQHYLASKQAIDIPIKHLYAEYRHWIEKKSPFSSVEDELNSLQEFRGYFRELLEVESDRPYSSVARTLSAFDIGTAYPLLLYLLASDANENELASICDVIESYIIRRAVCGLTNKNLNRVFLSLVRYLQSSVVSHSQVLAYFTGLRGESAEWPTDQIFGEAWISADIYRRLNNVRLCYILNRISEHVRSSKTESLNVDGELTVEHIMPQSWEAHWPLSSGASGMTYAELWEAEENDARAVETRRRNQLIQTMGNLTILTSGLNSSVSNSPWSIKRPELLKHSLLPINLALANVETWDDEAIVERGKWLFDKALIIWPRNT
ncbi:MULTISPECIES: DUF262 domain-containing protein [unclassified Sphingomonas]|uniref:DUF262 domain-containing protein n=1 Tax=unclassified Sphingomonas TaxID=196159 RepID=UPI0009E85C05|nr:MULTISPECIES: DUF262 domain-containing protein [unclassified Sphingomonas]